jgi:hypothetical protein
MKSVAKLNARLGSTWTWANKIKATTPVFSITPKNGFLPIQDPIQDLPKEFSKMNELMHRMPLVLEDGKPGLLAKGEFGNAVKELPLYDVSKIEDQALLMALFRDYTFGKLLESFNPPSHIIVSVGAVRYHE